MQSRMAFSRPTSPEKKRIGVSHVRFYHIYVPSPQSYPVADRLLAPCFSPASVLGMFDGMMDIISQLLLKWER